MSASSHGVRINVHLQHSYGFIQCCDREARLFFHFSEYSGSLEEMKVGGKRSLQCHFKVTIRLLQGYAQEQCENVDPDNIDNSGYFV